MLIEYYDHLGLGPFKEGERGQRAIIFRDLDQDQRVELIAPLESSARLTPLPILIPVPYRITDQGLRLEPALIQASAPERNKRRSWLLAHQREQLLDQPESLSPRSELAHIFSQAQEIYRYAALLCLKAKCDQGDELIYFAYPQHDLLLRMWEQLKRCILNPQPHTPHRSTLKPSSEHPFSILQPHL